MIPAPHIMRQLGLEPDPWQLEVLESEHPRILLNCCRQAGKSTVVVILGLVKALMVPWTKVLLLSRSHRQSMELLHTASQYYERFANLPRAIRQNSEEMEFSNHSRMIALPCKEETIRGYAHIDLLIIDEAARVPDDLYRSVRPMLAVSNGRLILLSTPFGKRGFFFDCWTRQQEDWQRIEVPASKIPRIRPAFLAEEERALGEAYFRQEYCCAFEAMEGLVFPDLGKCVVPASAFPYSAGLPARAEKVGGIDFGFKNPFAAVWGLVDADNVLWLTNEYYARGKPLSVHALHLPREVFWYADPSGANERSELRIADFQVCAGKNDLRSGIGAVNARIEAGKLRIVEGKCPNLLAESGLYRYPENGHDQDAEKPIDQDNHALSALRYLIATRDGGQFLRRTLQALRKDSPETPVKPKEKPWLRWDNEALYRPLPGRW